MEFLQRKKRDIPGKPFCMAAPPHFAASNTFLMTRTRKNAFLLEKKIYALLQKSQDTYPNHVENIFCQSASLQGNAISQWTLLYPQTSAWKCEKESRLSLEGSI